LQNFTNVFEARQFSPIRQGQLTMLKLCSPSCTGSVLLTFTFLSFLTCCATQLSDDPNELLNWCIDGIRHKDRPSAEDELHKACTPWMSRACCTHNVTRDIHTTSSYNFDWNHCGNVKELSPQCKRHFIQDLCFYECEPNVGPWVVKIDMQIRKERYVNVPICASDCEAWFNDCRNDFTCVENWTTMFVWKDGKNTCPLTKACLPYHVIFHDARHFCETIWDSSWRYTPDDKSCMRLWFNGSLGNPNDRVAEIRVAELLAKWNGQPPSKLNFTLLASTFTFVLAIWHYRISAL